MRKPSVARVHFAALRGRPFLPGNRGRKPGSKNRTTVVAAALLDGQAEVLLRTAFDLAKDGDVPMLKFLLDRLLPRDRLIKFDLPQMQFADDAVEALGRILRAMSEAQISPSEAAALATLVTALLRQSDRWGRFDQEAGRTRV